MGYPASYGGSLIIVGGKMTGRAGGMVGGGATKGVATVSMVVVATMTWEITGIGHETPTFTRGMV